MVNIEGIASAITKQWFGGDVPWSKSLHDLITSHLRARLRARAASSDTIACRIIRRPTEKVSTWVVPEDGVYVTKQKNNIPYSDADELYNCPYSMAAGDAVGRHYDAIRRIDTDEPTTWIERTETETPREWRAEDIPSGHLAFFDGEEWFMIHRDTPAHNRTEWLNDAEATHILVLPESL